MGEIDTAGGTQGSEGAQGEIANIIRIAPTLC